MSKIPLDIEAVLLTGGASRRMGTDKAKLLVEGEPLAQRIARQISPFVNRLTILGREPLEGYGFQADLEEFEGPLSALSRFEPRSSFVFVASCDLPAFDGRAIPLLREQIGESDVAAMSRQDRLQPLCALYRVSCWPPLRQLVESGERRMMRWLDRLQVVTVNESDLAAAGLPPDLARNVNRPEEFEGQP